MRRSQRFILGLAVAMAATPTLAAGPHDGTYRGEQRTIRTNNSASCQNMDHALTIRVVDGRFSKKWGPGLRDTIEVEVKPDGTLFGSVSASAGTRGPRAVTREYIMSGKIAGGVMEAEIGSSLCAVKVTLRKS